MAEPRDNAQFCLDDVIKVMQQRADAVRSALREADSDDLQEQSQQFGQLAQELAIALQQAIPYRVMDSQAVATQVSDLARDIASLREQLLRYQAYTDQAVQTLFPSLRDKPTYAASLGGRAATRATVW